MLTSIISKYCVGIPLSLVLSLIQVESGANPNSISKDVNPITKEINYNYGLMQLNTKTAKSFCGIANKEYLLIPEVNIECGCSYLVSQKKKYGNDYMALLAYNKGSVPKTELKTFMSTSYVKLIIRHSKYFKNPKNL